MLRRVLPAALLTAVLAASACKGKTEEAKIHDLIDDAVSSIEAGRPGDAMDHVSESYRDDAGNDKSAVRGVLAGQALRGSRVTVVRRDERIVVEGTSATASFDAALFQGDRAKLRGLVPQRSGTYRFTLTLEKDAASGDWLVTKASWKPIPAASFVVNAID